MGLPLLRLLSTADCKINRSSGYLVTVIVNKFDHIANISCIFTHRL